MPDDMDDDGAIAFARLVDQIDQRRHSMRGPVVVVDASGNIVGVDDGSISGQSATIENPGMKRITVQD